MAEHHRPRLRAAPAAAAVALSFLVVSIAADLSVEARRSARPGSGPGRYLEAHGDSPVAIDGAWELYEGRLVDPSAFGGSGQPLPDAMAAIDGDIAGAKKKGTAFSAYRTWRVRLEGLLPGREYGLAAGPFIDAAAIYVDGQPAARLGRPAKAAWSERDSLSPQVIPFEGGEDGSVDIVVHASGWSGTGGIAYTPPVVGGREAMDAWIALSRTVDALTIGAMAALAAVAALAARWPKGKDKPWAWLSGAFASAAISASCGGSFVVAALVPGIAWPAVKVLAIVSMAALCASLARIDVAEMARLKGQRRGDLTALLVLTGSAAAAALLPALAPAAFGLFTRVALLVALAALGGAISGAVAEAIHGSEADRASDANRGDARRPAFALIRSRSAIRPEPPGGSTSGSGQASIRTGQDRGDSNDDSALIAIAAELDGRGGASIAERWASGFIAVFEAGAEAALGFAVEAYRGAGSALVAAVDVGGETPAGAMPAVVASGHPTFGGAEVGRLQSLARIAAAFGVSAVASGRAIAELGSYGRFGTRFIGNAKDPSTGEILAVHEAYDGEPAEIRRGRAESALIFQDALAEYRSRRFDAAAERFARVLEAVPSDGPALRYLAESRRRSAR